MPVAVDSSKYSMSRGVARCCGTENYTENFGLQWNRFAENQLDGVGMPGKVSEQRLFATTGWTPESLDGLSVLEVGSGAGRFSRVVLERTKADLYSVDFSSAVDANLASNGHIAPDRFHLFQASIYDLPFANGSFDRTFCLGVLQHTPDFEASVKALVDKTRKGGEIVVDFYPVRGWWTKVHAKYLLRPVTTRLEHGRLMALIEANVPWMLKAYDGLNKLGLGAVTRFLPICDMNITSPSDLSSEQRRQWAIMDTFDQYSPAYDNPQRIEDVAAMFERSGASVKFAEFLHNGLGEAAVVRAVKR